MNQLDSMETAFLEIVRLYHEMGYSRMMQIVSREWFRRAIDENLCPASGVRVPGTCYGLMSIEDQEDYHSGYNADPLFNAWAAEMLHVLDGDEDDV
jgi:hypothetical protein